MKSYLIATFAFIFTVYNTVIEPTNSQVVGLCTVNLPFQCSNGNCIHKYLTCDGRNDCRDNSDESSPSPCPSGALDYFKDDYLIVCDGNIPGLFQIQMSTGDVRHLRTASVLRPVALDIDPVNKDVYYSDVNSRTISKFSMTSQQTQLLHQDLTGTSVFDGLTLDLERRLMYVSDARFITSNYFDLGGNAGNEGNGSIIELGFDGNFLRTIIQEYGMLPRALQLDKVNRVLYWSDWGTGRAGIYKISLVGSNQKVPIITGLVWPNALAVDFQKQVMFWADSSTGVIETSNLDGTNRRVVLSGAGSRYFGMTLTSTYVYVTDWNSMYVKRFDRNTFQFQSYTNQAFGQLFGIIQYQNQSGVNSTATTRTPVSNSPTAPTSATTKTSLTVSTTSSETPRKVSVPGDANDSLGGTAPTQSTWSTSSAGVTSPGSSGLSTTTIIIVAVVVGGVVLIASVVTCGFVIFFITRRNKKRTENNTGTNNHTEQSGTNGVYETPNREESSRAYDSSSYTYMAIYSENQHTYYTIPENSPSANERASTASAATM